MKIEMKLGLVLFWAGLCGACDRAPTRGDCEPGYLQVGDRCELAVGMACEGGCLSRICVEDDEGREFCTVACDSHDDCPVAFFCDESRDGRCYPGQRPWPCRSDVDCQACERCQAGECIRLDGCQLCGSDLDCGACRRCQDGECVEVEACTICVDDRDCGPCEFCDPAQRICLGVPGCLRCGADVDCPVCTRCEAGACVDDVYVPGLNERGCYAPCFNDGSCPLRTACLYDRLEVANNCLPVGLAFGADCGRGSDAQCASGVCVDAQAGASCSMLCEQKSDCPVGADCAVGQDCRLACRPVESEPLGALCERDRDCPVDSVCGLEAWQGAWRGRCRSPEPCAKTAGQDCDAAAGDRCANALCSPLGSCAPLCASDSDCPRSHVCSRVPLSLPDTGLPAPVRLCARLPGPVADLGEACSGGSEDCVSGDCMEPGEGPGHPICVAACIAGAGQCADGQACRPRADAPAAYACQPAPVGGACRQAADCQDELLCVLSASEYSLACAPALGPGSPGAACRSGLDCGTGLCASPGLCAHPCAEAGHCAEGLVCDGVQALMASGASLRLTACVPAPGSLSLCRTDADCPPFEVCAPQPDGWTGGLDGACRLPSGAAELGQVCAAAIDCDSAWCTDSGRCASCCVSDEDCPAGFACGLAFVSAPGSAEVRLCLPAAGGLGEACPDGHINCLSGPCLQPPDAEPYCSLACEQDEDCAAGAGMICIGQADGTGLCGWAS